MHSRKMSVLIFLILWMVGCTPSHITAANRVCACFDVANYKISKGHPEAAQAFDRCRDTLNKYSAQYAEPESIRDEFVGALKSCPQASIVPSRQ